MKITNKCGLWFCCIVNFCSLFSANPTDHIVCPPLISPDAVTKKRGFSLSLNIYLQDIDLKRNDLGQFRWGGPWSSEGPLDASISLNREQIILLFGMEVLTVCYVKIYSIILPLKSQILNKMMKNPEPIPK